MKSRITIEVDFENGNEPVIQIIRRNSDDVRDSLISSFLQKLQGYSWCRIKWCGGDYEGVDRFERIRIWSLNIEDLRKELPIIQEEIRKADEYEAKQPVDLINPV